MKPSGSGHSRIIAHPRGTRESRPELEAPARFLDRVKTRFPAAFVESAMVTADRERRNPHVDLSRSLRATTTEFALIYARPQIKREIESFFPPSDPPPRVTRDRARR